MLISERPRINLYHANSEIAIKKIKNNEHDLAIVDPPYGIGQNWKKEKSSRFYHHETSYKNEKPPPKSYFQNLFRISKNQIIWGANYFWNYLPPTSNIIWWDKLRDPEKHNYSSGELAWTSIRKWPANTFRFSWNGCANSEPRYGVHPHEKPIALYKWLLTKYASAGDKIIDTHLGGGSIVIACLDLGFDLDAFEIDPYYFETTVKRIKEYQSQLKIPFGK